MSYWMQQLLGWFGKQIPDDYLTFDYETTGIVRDFDLPIDFGYTLVRDREVVAKKSFILDWTRYPNLVEPAWLYSALERLKNIYAAKGDPYHYSMERLSREGKDPIKVLQFNYDLFQKNRDSGAAFGGHNAAFFDCEMARNVFLEYLGEKWVWGGNEVLDTGAMAKALEVVCKLPPDRWYAPEDAGETMFDFFQRVTRGRLPGIIWNAGECARRHKLAERFGIDLAALHGAEADSYVCYLLIEDHRNGRLDPAGIGPG